MYICIYIYIYMCDPRGGNPAHTRSHSQYSGLFSKGTSAWNDTSTGTTLRKPKP